MFFLKKRIKLLYAYQSTKKVDNYFLDFAARIF
jgi:hypothetical protein